MGQIVDIVTRLLAKESPVVTDPKEFGDRPTEVARAAGLRESFNGLMERAIRMGLSYEDALRSAAYAHFMVGFEVGRVFEREQNADTRSTDPAA